MAHISPRNRVALGTGHGAGAYVTCRAAKGPRMHTCDMKVASVPDRAPPGRSAAAYGPLLGTGPQGLSCCASRRPFSRMPRPCARAGGSAAVWSMIGGGGVCAEAKQRGCQWMGQPGRLDAACRGRRRRAAGTPGNRRANAGQPGRGAAMATTTATRPDSNRAASGCSPWRTSPQSWWSWPRGTSRRA